MTKEVLFWMTQFLYSTLATFFFSLIMRSPRKAMVLSALFGGVGYVVYRIVLDLWATEIAAYFIATLFIAAAGEFSARIKKMPAPVFIFPAVIPLVPGTLLYYTMVNVVQGEIIKALTNFVQTLLLAGAMAMAMALTNIVLHVFFDRKKRLRPNKIG